MGEWVRGKWGIAPAKSLSELRGDTTFQATAQESNGLSGRTPGINQTGTIPGLWTMKAVPSDVQPQGIDEEGLREGLIE